MRGVRAIKNIPHELSLVVLVKNWFRVVSFNDFVRKMCREFLPGRVPGRVPGQNFPAVSSFICAQTKNTLHSHQR